MRTTPTRRRGIALMMVVVSTVLVLSAWSLANRQVGALLRLRAAHADRIDGLFDDDEAAAADPRLLAMARGLALFDCAGFPADQPDGPTAYASGFDVDIDPGPATSPSPCVLEFGWDAGQGTWSVVARTGGAWDALAAGDVAPPSYRGALDRGLDAIAAPGFPAGQPAGDPVAYRAEVVPGVSFALEFVKVDEGGGEGPWLVSAYAEAEWGDSGKQPPWDQLTTLPE